MDCNLFEINICYGFGDIKAINLLCQQSPVWLIVTLKVLQKLERAWHTLRSVESDSEEWPGEDDSSWSIHGNLLIANYLNYGPWQIIFVADYSQAVCTVAEVASGKSHAQTVLINGRDSAHDGVWSLLHVCVATVAVLTDGRQLEILSAALHALCTMPYMWKGELYKERESIRKFT